MKLAFGPLRFLPIDLTKHAKTCIEFRVDSFVASFGSPDGFYKESGADGAEYLDWLRNKLEKNPWSAVHVWEDDEIIGQMELGTYKPEPGTGYIHLYYLHPKKRGAGYSKYLEEYAATFMAEMGFKRARLSVSPTNLNALGFYKKMGWTDVGIRPGYDNVRFMEKVFSI